MNQMAVQDVKELIRRMVEAFDRGDVSDVESFVGAGYVDHQGIGGEEIRGPKGFRRVVELARSSFADLSVSIEDLLADGDRVAVRLRWVGSQKSDGTVVKRETIDIVAVKSGKAVEHWGVRTWINPD